MNTNKHFPLSKPPQVAAESNAVPTPATAQITRERVATLNRYNKLFFIFGLLALALGLYTYMEKGSVENKWAEDRKKLDRYEKMFKRFPDQPTLTIRNDKDYDLLISEFSVSYVINEEDSIRYHKYDIASMPKADNGFLTLNPGKSQDFSIPKERKEKVKGLFFGLFCIDKNYIPKVYSSTVIPENGIIWIK